MIHSVRFIALLDTNVIYPIISRDLLFWFAHYDLYTPKWSSNIFDEWRDVMIRKGVLEKEAIKRVNKAKSLDDFFTDIIDLNQEKAIEAFKEMVVNKRNPPLDAYDILNKLRIINLNDTANYIRALL